MKYMIIGLPRRLDKTIYLLKFKNLQASQQRQPMNGFDQIVGRCAGKGRLSASDPTSVFLAFDLIDPRSLLHLKHSFCLHRI